jgi:hypothetical protein
MRFVLLLMGLTTTLGACQTGAVASRCHGGAFGLNAAHWQPSAADIQACSRTAYGR